MCHNCMDMCIFNKQNKECHGGYCLAAQSFSFQPVSKKPRLTCNVIHMRIGTPVIRHLRIGSCLACVYRVMDARGKFGEHERSIRVARGVAESNSSFLSALQTSQVHPIT